MPIAVGGRPKTHASTARREAAPLSRRHPGRVPLLGLRYPIQDPNTRLPNRRLPSRRVHGRSNLPGNGPILRLATPGGYRPVTRLATVPGAPPQLPPVVELAVTTQPKNVTKKMVDCCMPPRPRREHGSSKAYPHARPGGLQTPTSLSSSKAYRERSDLHNLLHLHV